jgi:hypothetical protein
MIARTGDRRLEIPADGGFYRTDGGRGPAVCAPALDMLAYVI